MDVWDNWVEFYWKINKKKNAKGKGIDLISQNKLTNFETRELSDVVFSYLTKTQLQLQSEMAPTEGVARTRKEQNKHK